MSSETFYLSIISAALVLSVMGLLFVGVMPGIDSWSRHFFRGLFSVLLACCLSVLIDLRLPPPPALHSAKFFIEFFNFIEKFILHFLSNIHIIN